jgi:hypothetical protein
MRCGTAQPVKPNSAISAGKRRKVPNPHSGNCRHTPHGFPSCRRTVARGS